MVPGISHPHSPERAGVTPRALTLSSLLRPTSTSARPPRCHYQQRHKVSLLEEPSGPGEPLDTSVTESSQPRWDVGSPTPSPCLQFTDEAAEAPRSEVTGVWPHSRLGAQVLGALNPALPPAHHLAGGNGRREGLEILRIHSTGTVSAGLSARTEHYPAGHLEAKRPEGDRADSRTST